MNEMTTQAEIRAEITRQGTRLGEMVRTGAPKDSIAILSASIIDLLALDKVYPRTYWAGEPGDAG
jgi:hypothetical protein